MLEYCRRNTIFW